MQLKVEGLAVEDSWKDIIRIKNKYRKDSKGRHIRRGSICCVSVGDKLKWVILHGREDDDAVIQMDLNARLALGVKKGQTHDFQLERLSWLKSLWFPWKSSDPTYRVPAQLSLIALILGVVLGVVGIVIGLIPIYENHHRASTHQCSEPF
ncbi:MAG TPA: hypothetical protein VKT33_10765 [Candidatus Angelobacter sp.]|nr:hypothetical protein [Candidatus Angelobacter sp.]